MSEKKCIWLICKYASPEKYFFGTRHFYLSEEWVKNGFDVTIFTSNSSHLSNKLPDFKEKVFIEFINGVRTIWFKLPKAKSSSSIKRILSWIIFEYKLLLFRKKQIPKPNVVIASSLSILSIISGYYLAKKHNAKFILEIRDIWPLSAIHLGGFSKRNPFIWVLQKLECFGYRNADVIIGTMPNLIEHVQNVEPNFKRCICIPQGIKMEFLTTIEPLPNEYKESVFSKGTFKIVYAGTINRNNPIKILLEVVNDFPESENIEVYILGTGSMLASYKAEFSKNKRIKFIEPIPKKHVVAFLNEVDLCFDSIDSEISKYGLSRNKWIDYMNSGNPIVCSYSGFQSMINEANCGSFTPFGDKEALTKEIFRYKKLGEDERFAIKERSRRFLLENRLFSKLALDYQTCF